MRYGNLGFDLSVAVEAMRGNRTLEGFISIHTKKGRVLGEGDVKLDLGALRFDPKAGLDVDVFITLDKIRGSGQPDYAIITLLTPRFTAKLVMSSSSRVIAGDYLHLHYPITVRKVYE